jgi:hypothetical protein
VILGVLAIDLAAAGLAQLAVGTLFPLPTSPLR